MNLPQLMCHWSGCTIKEMAQSKDTKPTQLLDEIDPLTAAQNQQNNDTPACLMIIYGHDVGRTFWLTRDKMVLGREREQVDIWLDSEHISRKHCRIIKDQDGYFVEDLGSMNGTIIENDRVTTRQELPFGHKIQCGDMVLQLLRAGSLERRFADRLREAAMRDELTNAYTKKIIPEIEHEFLKGTRFSENPLTIFMVDIDHFKQLNDTHGHIFGDQVLSSVSQTIQKEVIRKRDLFVRFGGEEFLLILPGVDLPTAESLGERLRHHVRETAFKMDKRAIRVTISIGGCTWCPGVKVRSLYDLIHKADLALYESKRTGRNKVTTTLF